MFFFKNIIVHYTIYVYYINLNYTILYYYIFIFYIYISLCVCLDACIPVHPNISIQADHSKLIYVKIPNQIIWGCFLGYFFTLCKTQSNW